MNRFFLRHFLRDPKAVGALVPLSESVARNLVEDLVNRNESRPWRILEAGAGTGNVTASIIKHLHKGDRLDVVEIDTECCKLLAKKFGNLPHVSTHCVSILDWRPEYRYDLIVSTLPLNTFSPPMVSQVLKHYQEISSENGVCTYVEYKGLAKLGLLFSKGEKKKLAADRMKMLQSFHKEHLFQKESIYANFLPCNVYHMKLHEEAVSK